MNSEVEAISRLFEIVDNTMLESTNAKKLEYDKTKFENVIIAQNVEYSIGRRKIIHNMNLKVKFGDNMALIGQEGSGRKTLVDMLLGMKKPNEREESCIFLFGKYINDLNPIDYRTKIKYLKEDANLFSGTLRENVDPQHKYSDEEIIKLLHFLKFLDILKRDTGKYDNRELAEHMASLKFQKGMLSNSILKKSMKKRNDGMSTLIKTNFGKGVNSSKTKSIYKKWKDYYEDKSKRMKHNEAIANVNPFLNEMKDQTTERGLDDSKISLTHGNDRVNNIRRFKNKKSELLKKTTTFNFQSYNPAENELSEVEDEVEYTPKTRKLRGVARMIPILRALLLDARKNVQHKREKEKFDQLIKKLKFDKNMITREDSKMKRKRTIFNKDF